MTKLDTSPRGEKEEARRERERREREYFEARKPIPPMVTKSDSIISDTVEEHPAYGQIDASRVSASGGFLLYGSDFEHQHFITITIRRSKLYRGLSNDREHADDELIEVALSEAQWATFVSTLNSGEGTQCTIQHIDRKPVHQIAAKADRREQITAEANENLSEIVRDLKTLSDEIEGKGRKTVMRDLVSRITAQFSSHSGIAFIAKQFGEHIEKTVEHAKIEVHAYISRHIERSGLKALGAPVKFLEKKKDGDA